jgi:hypothetical protein
MLSMRCRRGSEGRSDRKMRRRPLKRFFAFQRFPGGYGRLCGGRIRMRSLATSGASGGVHCKPRRRIRPGIARLLCLVGAEPRGFHSQPRMPASVRHEPRARGDRTIFARRRRRVSSMPSPAQGPTSVSQASPRNIRCAAARRAQPDRAGASRAVSRHRTGCEITDRPRKADGPAAATGRSCADGIAGQTIATRLGIFEKTVGNHFRGMYKRLGISKRS